MDFKAKPTAPKTTAADAADVLTTKDYVDQIIQFDDSGASADWLDAKYKIKIINGKPYLEVVDV